MTVAARADRVRELRDRTGAGVMDCKAALEASSGDLQGAVEFLRKKGLADAAKKQHRDAREGLVASYIHPGARIGVLVEVDCETDFVARTEAFQQLVKDIAMQVAAANPSFVAREDVPETLLEKEREIFRTQLADQKKAEQCLLEQPFVKDATGKTRVKDLVAATTAQTGERVVVKRFARFQVGESA